MRWLDRGHTGTRGVGAVDWSTRGSRNMRVGAGRHVLARSGTHGLIWLALLASPGDEPLHHHSSPRVLSHSSLLQHASSLSHFARWLSGTHQGA
jgi:hypothetical protein